MATLPTRFAPLILRFAILFRQSTWRHAQLLLVGAVLAPGTRTVASVLRILGCGQDRRFSTYHRVLNRAVWCSRRASALLLRLLVRRFALHGPVVLGLDDTIERRRGKRIRAKGIYRDPVRSSRSHFVKASGLRWLSLMLLAPIPWAGRVWALPFLTALAPSERACREQGRRHKTLTDWARQVVLQAQRWLPGRPLVLVADSTFAALELLATLSRRGITCVTRLRLDAALYEPAPPRPPGTPGRPRKKGARLPALTRVLAEARTRWTRLTIPDWYGQRSRRVELCSGTAVWDSAGRVVPLRWVLLRDPQGRFDPQALLCTDRSQPPLQIVRWFIWRWQVEVTFEEARRHLGLETQRQWSDRAIARTTPVLLGLFSLVTLLASRLTRGGQLPVQQTAWYHKRTPTFSDTLATVRTQFWWARGFAISRAAHDQHNLPRTVLAGLTDALCYAA